MQDDPEKLVANYNEFHGNSSLLAAKKGVLDIQTGEGLAINPQEIVNRGLSLVNSKIDAILGGPNKLTGGDSALPKIKFIPTEPAKPNVSGYFSWDRNEINLVLDKIADNPQNQTKVFIHEYIHFLSHNGRDDSERVNEDSPIAHKNNIGFSRNFGLDIRKGKEDGVTKDYFLSFNEAVTEQLSIDILPGVHETYSDYRGLLNQVLEDAVTRGLGSNDNQGRFQAWSKEQFKNYVYKSFLKGDLDGFTALLKTVYKKYNISEQQFGLMTNRDDLPSVVEQKFKASHPSSPPPAVGLVAVLVQQRLDSKTRKDYITDVVGPEPDDSGDPDDNIHGMAYDTFVKENNIFPSSKLKTSEGRVLDVDNNGRIIYRGDDALQILGYIRGELDKLLVELRNGKISSAQLTDQVDDLLFDRYNTSMLSEGFRDLYIYKHTKLGESH